MKHTTRSPAVRGCVRVPHSFQRLNKDGMRMAVGPVLARVSRAPGLCPGVAWRPCYENLIKQLLSLQD